MKTSTILLVGVAVVGVVLVARALTPARQTPLQQAGSALGNLAEAGKALFGGRKTAPAPAHEGSHAARSALGGIDLGRSAYSMRTPPQAGFAAAAYA